MCLSRRSSSTFVFLGPTLARDVAASFLDATYLPPAACGDIYRLLAAKPLAIGIVDGAFEQQRSVLHKEILYALSHGVRVFGASSMGALRAAELHEFGMEGVGEIFHAYRSGVLEDDDEVAIAHAPSELGFVALSVAMINVRYALRLAHKKGAISARARDLCLNIAKNMYYQGRTWEAVLGILATRGVNLAAFKLFLATEKPDLKRDDAIVLLRRMSEFLSSEEPLRLVNRPKCPETLWWRRLRATIDCGTALINAR